MPAERCQALLASGTNAFRLGSGPGGWVERLGEDVLISHKGEAALAELLAGLTDRGGAPGWSPARIFTRFLPWKNAERVPPVLHHGDPTLPSKFVVAESGVRYEIDLAAGYSHGLFLDQRLNRAKLRALKPRRVLNTFAYTCSFSVVAALAGAETVSIDLSRKSLDRGLHNLRLNGVDPAKHRFLADDALEVLPRLDAAGERFDAIILDPPTFSRGANGRRWQVEEHFEDLLGAALELALPHGSILLSTNCKALDPAVLERRARACAKSRRRSATYLHPAPPEDFPPGHGSSAIWMLLR
jgi:23S rRNA (cytosine1962-C5)-methyltransferase